MNEQINTPKRPSALASLVRGAASGLISGAIMAGIIFGITLAFPALGGLGWAGAALMISASTLFGGVMAAKRAIFDAPGRTHSAHMVPVPVPMQGMSGPAMTPSMDIAADVATEQAPTKNWVASTGRSETSRGAIDQILANGPMTDKERSEAILASRDVAADQHASR